MGNDGLNTPQNDHLYTHYRNWKRQFSFSMTRLTIQSRESLRKRVTKTASHYHDRVDCLAVSMKTEIIVNTVARLKHHLDRS